MMMMLLPQLPLLFDAIETRRKSCGRLNWKVMKKRCSVKEETV